MLIETDLLGLQEKYCDIEEQNGFLDDSDNENFSHQLLLLAHRIAINRLTIDL